MRRRDLLKGSGTAACAGPSRRLAYEGRASDFSPGGRPENV